MEDFNKKGILYVLGTFGENGAELEILRGNKFVFLVNSKQISKDFVFRLFRKVFRIEWWPEHRHDNVETFC